MRNVSICLQNRSSLAYTLPALTLQIQSSQVHDNISLLQHFTFTTLHLDNSSLSCYHVLYIRHISILHSDFNSNNTTQQKSRPSAIRNTNGAFSSRRSYHRRSGFRYDLFRVNREEPSEAQGYVTDSRRTRVGFTYSGTLEAPDDISVVKR